MISDGVVELGEAGVITNKKKTLHRQEYPLICEWARAACNDYLDDNPAVGVIRLTM